MSNNLRSKAEAIEYFTIRANEVFGRLGYEQVSDKTWILRHSDEIFSYIRYGAMKGMVWYPSYGYALKFVPLTEKSVKKDRLVFTRIPQNMATISTDGYFLTQHDDSLDLRLNVYDEKTAPYNASQKSIDSAIAKVESATVKIFDDHEVIDEVRTAYEQYIELANSKSHGLSYYLSNQYLGLALVLKRMSQIVVANRAFEKFIVCFENEQKPSKKLVDDFNEYYLQFE